MKAVATEFEALLTRIEQGMETAADLQRLREALTNSTAQVVQLGKYNIHINEGQEVQIGDRTYVEINTAAVEAIVTAIQQPPTTVSIPHNLPFRHVTSFVGRSRELDQLHRQLQEGNQGSIVSIVGMGGIGKTELALQYAYTHLEQQAYPGGLCWLRAREGEIGSQIVTFARSWLGLKLPDWLETLSEQVSYCWQHWREGAVLLILDDVTDYALIQPYLHKDARFKVLLTTRLQLGRSFQQLDLQILEEAAALELLKALTNKERIDQKLDQAKQLCQWLGYLPLALELVGRYLAQKPDLLLTEMQQRLEKKQLNANALRQVEAGMTASLGVAAAFELSWQELDATAQELCYLLSLFALAPIAWIWVEQCFLDRDSEDLEDLRDNQLIRLSLLQRLGKQNYLLHQLIREFFQAKLHIETKLQESKDLGQRVCQVLAEAARNIPEAPAFAELANYSPMLPHLENSTRRLVNFYNNDDLISVLIGIARFYEGQGLYQQAELWYRQCLDITETRFGAEHLMIAQVVSYLASNYRAQGRYGEAEALFSRALSTRQSLLSSDDPQIADSLDDLGVILTEQQDYEQAVHFCIQALEIRRQNFGLEHSAVAESLNNLASVYNGQGRYSEAEPLFLEALSIRKRILNPDHPSIVVSLGNLANCYQSQKKYELAEPLYIEALQRSKCLMGEEHPNVAIGLNNLASLYFNQKRYEEARPLWLQALELHKKFLGDTHPDVALNLSNLASLYDVLGQFQEAEDLYRQTLAMREVLFGEDHPKIAITINKLAKLYFVQKRYSDAEPLYVRALTILTTHWGEEHPSTIRVQKNLQELQQAKTASDSL